MNKILTVARLKEKKRAWKGDLTLFKMTVSSRKTWSLHRNGTENIEFPYTKSPNDVPRALKKKCQKQSYLEINVPNMSRYLDVNF